MLSGRKGQSSLEYALVISVVIAALMGLNQYMQRGMHGRLKESADVIGRHFDPATFKTARKVAGDGLVETKTTETRLGGTGATDDDTTSTIAPGAEKLTRSEYDDWGTKPSSHVVP
jgi:hypothetical protein